MGMRFIRVNGRVVPIKDKDPSKQKLQKNYKKYGDGANQSSRIDRKYSDKATKGTIKYGVVAAGGAVGAFFSKGKTAAALGIVGATAAIIGHLKTRKNLESSEVSKEREYVRAFGVTSDGKKPSKKFRTSV